jgi:hypothetical protein
MIKRILFSVITVILLLQGTLFPGTTGKIAGIIKDSQSGEPLFGVNVLVDGTTMGASTNLDGYYVILNVPPGKYNITASAIGYTKKSVQGASVSVDLTTTLNFQLESTVLEVGEGVVITADRQTIKKDLTSSEARVDADQIATLPVSEVAEVLSLQAGITVDRGGGIHIRGGRTSEVAYWVDGISVSDVYDGGQAVQVDNNSVQELQVISGTFNAEYGQAMSGIVNIVTKDGDQQYKGSISTYVGDYLTSDNWKNDGRITYVGAQAPTDRKDGELFYNLGNIRPADNYNIEGSLSGPLAGVHGMTFYLSGRYFRSNGYLYGNHIFNPNGSANFEITPDFFILDDAGNIVGVKLPDNPSPMNGRKRLSGQAKLTFQLNGEMKVSVSALGSKIDYRDYNHEYTLNPDGDVQKFDRGYNYSALWTHTLNGTSFYTLNLSLFQKSFREYLYADPLDPRYIVDPAVQSRPSAWAFRTMGTNLHQFKRNTETRVAKLDYTNQVSQLHQVKLGLEGKLHRLYLEDYNVSPNTNGDLVPTIPVRTSNLYEEYTEKPVEFSAYIQDKLEYENMIVNVGVRYDYFDSKGKVLSDPADPNVYLPRKVENTGLTLEQRLQKWYKNATVKFNVSPRLGISYPITDKGILHFSYGHFLQIPSFIHLYQKPEYKVTTSSTLQGVYGNSDLKAQKTVMYEIGLQQEVAEDLSFDATLFYRDTRDWVTTSPSISVGDATTSTSSYTTYINRDYANSRGITLSVNKRPIDLLSFNFSYTFQVAEGINSNPDDEQAAQQNNSEPARTLTPLDWDQTHTANLTVGIGKSDWGAFALARYGSGLPYSPANNQAESSGQDAVIGVKKNSRRRPENYTVDLRLFKNVTLGNINASFFVKVFNLLDRRNETEVYGQTGRATVTSAAIGASSVENNVQINPISTYLIRPDYYSEPREVQVGVEINF